MDTIQQPASTTPEPFNALTPRELQVAMRLALGATNREIAKELGIDQKTVDTHRAHALSKIGAKNNVVLARIALRSGLTNLIDE